LAAIFESARARIGVTSGQLLVLTVISAHPSINQATLGRAIGFDKVTTSQLLRGLEARAMLTRENAANRRGVSLKLTTAGIALLDTAAQCI
jgi:MarR family transcriptional regulator, lower aerobic nicotinate degradation pathway regulator